MSVASAPQITRGISAFAIVAAAATGCILLVEDPRELGAICLLARGGGDCESCVTRRCRAELDACCADPECRPLLDDIDACASGASIEACGEIGPVSGATGAAARLRTCVGGCGAHCQAGPMRTRCTSGVSSTSNSPGCTCTLDAEPNGDLCSVESVGGGVCCRRVGWPSTGKSCACRAWSCQKTGAGCECSFGQRGPDRTCTGKYCCRSNDTSRCACTDDTPCPEKTTQVERCEPGPHLCTEGELPVETCHVRTTEPAPQIAPVCRPVRDGLACRCDSARGPGSGTCNPSLFPTDRSLCCESDGYPAEGGVCVCVQVGCHRSFDRCSCDAFTTGHPTDSCRDLPVDYRCCRSNTTFGCYCSRAPCEDGDTQVATCDANTIRCGKGEFRAARCTP
jgi:hypothetical protein